MNVGGTTANLRVGNKRNKFKGMSQVEIDKITAENLDKVTRKIIRNLKARDFSTSTVSNLAVALGICVDKSRLLRGASTANLAVSGRLEATVRVQQLAQRLTGALGSAATSIPAGDNVSYTSGQVEEATDCQEVACLPATTEPVAAPRKRGRPRKTHPPATPPPSDQP